MKKNKKKFIIIGIIALILLIFIGLPQIVPKRYQYTYLCFKDYVSQDQIIYSNMLKECYTNQELKNNTLTSKMLDLYGLKILDKYDDNQTIYYLKENKAKDKQISVEDIYWKLEEFTDKDIMNQVGDKYKTYVLDGILYIQNEKNNESTKIFDDAPVKTFTMQPNGGDGNYKIIIHTLYDTIYVSKQTKDEILESLDKKDFDFDYITIKNIDSLIVTNIVNSLNEHNIYIVDKDGIKYDIEENKEGIEQVSEEYISYNVVNLNATEEQISNEDYNYKVNFKVIDGKLHITDKDNNVYIIDKISNVKNIGVFAPANDEKLYILTNDGKLYYIEDLINKRNSSDYKDADIEEIHFDSKIDSIGRTDEYVSPPYANFLVIKSNNKNYLFPGPRYDDYIEIKANWK